MAKVKIIEFDTVMLESDIYQLMEELTKAIEHIKATVPDEALYQTNGEPNIRTHWGAILFHTSMARVSLNAFLP